VKEKRFPVPVPFMTLNLPKTVVGRELKAIKNEKRKMKN